MNLSWTKYFPHFIRTKLEGRYELQRVLGNTSWLFADKVLRMGVGLLVGVWVARYLGPSLFGQLSYAGSLVALYTAVAVLGLDGVVVREVLSSPEKEAEILGTSFALRLSAGTLSYLLMIATVFILRPDDRVAHLMAGVMGWMLIANSFDTIDLWFQSRVLSKYVVYAKNFAFLFAATLRVYLVVVKAPLITFAIANVVEASLGAVGLIVGYRINKQSITRWKATLDIAKKLLATGWPLLLSSAVSMISFRADQVILGQLVDSKELGIYAAAVRIAEVWFFIPAAIVSSVFPNIVKAKATDDQEFHRRVQRLYSLLAFVGYAIAIPMTFLSKVVVTLLFGSAYAAAAPMLVVLLWSCVFVNLAMARGSYLIIMNMPWVLLFIAVVGAVSNIALNFLLIPKYGGVGAAVASLISYWIGAHGVCLLYKPLRKTGSMISRALLFPKFW